MTRLDRRALERLAALAALDLDERQIPALLAQIDRILEYASQLSDVEEPTAGTERPWLPADLAPPRPDVPRSAAAPAVDPSRFAPVYRDGWFVVPSPGGVTDE